MKRVTANSDMLEKIGLPLWALLSLALRCVFRFDLNFKNPEVWVTPHFQLKT